MAVCGLAAASTSLTAVARLLRDGSRADCGCCSRSRPCASDGRRADDSCAFALAANTSDSSKGYRAFGCCAGIVALSLLWRRDGRADWYSPLDVDDADVMESVDRGRCEPNASRRSALTFRACLLVSTPSSVIVAGAVTENRKHTKTQYHT